MTCATCTANTRLYGQTSPCTHDQAFSTAQAQLRAAADAPSLPLAASLLAGSTLPSLRVQQTTPTADKPGVRCFTCARAVQAGETYTRVEVDRWGSSKRGVLVTLAICGRCVEGAAPIKKRKAASV